MTLTLRELRVCLYKMSPFTDVQKWNEFKYKLDDTDKGEFMGCGNKVYDQIVQVPNFKRDSQIDFVIDLTPALEDGNFNS
jgi:hypothetical protein